MLNLSALLGVFTTLSFTSFPAIVCSENIANIEDHTIAIEQQQFENEHNIRDYSMSLEGNVVSGYIDIYHGSNRFQYASTSFLEINWSVKLEYFYNIQLQTFDGANIYGFLENLDMEETAYYSVELNPNLLNGRQYNTLETQLRWVGGVFDLNDWFAYIEDINSEEIVNWLWSDYSNSTAIMDFDYRPFEDYQYINFYNKWSFSDLYQEIDTLKSIYSINAGDNYASGYNSGYNIGYDEGYDTGYTANVENVSSQKYQEGYTKGYDDGYHANVGDGLSVQNILYTIVTMPATIIKQGFDFDILGINVGNLIQTALVIGLVVFAIGMFKKG